MIRIFEIKCATDQQSEIEAQLLKKLNISKKDLFSWSVHRKSIDARGQKISFSFVVDATVANEKKALKKKGVQPTPDETYYPAKPGQKPLTTRPVVVGFGPAGMFASLILAQAGYQPIVIERGSELKKRSQDVDTFWKTGQLNPEDNVQFGMGGAGAFSDGKLTTRSKDARARKVLEELVSFGANPEILIDQHPHIGSDAFLPIIENLRKEIERLGGSFYFDARLDDVNCKENQLSSLTWNQESHEAQAAILAIGHSAGDTIRMLHQRGVQIENKPFAVGVRIEHTQRFINQAMLKEASQDPRFIPARYQVTHTASNEKGVYSFCMCPGGYVIAASSHPGRLVINGMSYAARDNVNANSALLVQVNESDYGSQLFAGLDYQEQLEEKAYQASGSFQACAQLAVDYLENRVSTHFETVEPSYALGTTFVDLNTLFSDSVNQALHEGLLAFEKKVPGFLDGAILTGVESRSSSAVRICRDQHFMSNIQGLFPCGEGSGYAGGIMTSAIDGIKAAEKLIETYKLPEVQ